MVLENAIQIIELLPPELAKQIKWLVQAIGGFFVVYIGFSLVRIYNLRKQTKMIESIEKDVKKIRNKLRIK